ncbi:uncharacterized protein LOC115324407 [Ixodes scapularis]|uniref:uncharacterized protein LOC115324407 n=1 Tax=Ixodes scapularis TaxID=6945 RepID=UPI001A9FCAB1|nr:uncharacterized protein LOC115324407 [Ixodes scapularis]
MSNALFTCHLNVGIGISEVSVDKYNQNKINFAQKEKGRRSVQSKKLDFSLLLEPNALGQLIKFFISNGNHLPPTILLGGSPPTANGGPTSSVSSRKRLTPNLSDKMDAISDHINSNGQQEDGRPLLHPLQLVLQEISGTVSDENIPSKRIRTADVERDQGEDNTSLYSLRDITDETDNDEPYTVMTYRKNRETGIPVVFKPTTQNTSFWRVNPNVLANEIIAVTQEKIVSHKINKEGNLSVNVSSLDSANKLLAVTSLGEIQVTAHIPEAYSRNYGKVKHVPLEYSNDELLDYLKDFGVTSVQRQVAYRRQDDGIVEQHPSTTVVLTFRTDRAMPQRIYLGFTSHPVEEYFGQAVQCFNCQRYGHLARNCRGERRCKVCAGPHSHKECSSRKEPKCANCSGNHTSTYSGCPRKKVVTAAKQRSIINGRQTRRRALSPNPQVVRRQARPEHPNGEAPTKKTYSEILKRPRMVQKDQRNAQEDDFLPLEERPGRSTMPTPIPAPRRSRKTQAPPAGTPATYPMSNQSQHPRKQKDLAQVLLPLLFVALKAIIQEYPGANNIPEVEALLTMERLIIPISDHRYHK